MKTTTRFRIAHLTAWALPAVYGHYGPPLAHCDPVPDSLGLVLTGAVIFLVIHWAHRTLSPFPPSLWDSAMCGLASGLATGLVWGWVLP